MKVPEFYITYANLPDFLFSEFTPDPAPTANPYWINNRHGAEIGLDPKWLGGDQARNLFTGQTAPKDYTPLAMAYAGHQFGHLSPRLGDGRAALIGELTGPDGIHRDIHLKGSGATPFARRGDGKSTLRAAFKEVLFSEYLAALSIPATRSLAVYTTGEKIPRQALHPGAILVRTARSLIRVGTFQFAALNGSPEDIKALAEFLIAREYPDIEQSDERYAELLSAALIRQAELIAGWMAAGFIHGVMNTDNMALSGETIDFGPCAMMEVFRPDQVFSSIDHYGRYAWHNQAEIGLWNLTRFAESLLPIISDKPDEAAPIAEGVLDSYPVFFRHKFSDLLYAKIGLSPDEDIAEGFISGLLTGLGEAKVDFTLFFRRLSDCVADNDLAPVLDICETPDALADWLADWRSHLTRQGQDVGRLQSEMYKINPAYTLRMHLVENALSAAEAGDPALFHALMEAAQNPFEERADWDHFHRLSPAEPAYGQTFCET